MNADEISAELRRLSERVGSKRPACLFINGPPYDPDQTVQALVNTSTGVDRLIFPLYR